jgi:hypothetical protein
MSIRTNTQVITRPQAARKVNMHTVIVYDTKRDHEQTFLMVLATSKGEAFASAKAVYAQEHGIAPQDQGALVSGGISIYSPTLAF